MSVIVIDRYCDFVGLRRDWEEAYAVDVEANYFLSWSFMSTWLGREEDSQARNQEGWFILALRSGQPTSRYVAFLPLRLRKRQTATGVLNDELAMGGRKYADYTGFVSRPEHRDAAIAAFLAHVKSLDWQRWRLECLRLSSAEIERWLRHFPTKLYDIRRVRTLNPGEDIDQELCPYVPLSNDWESYLATRLSANARQKLRRLLRQVYGSDVYRITHAGPKTAERDIKILLHWWRTKWRDVKGDRLESMTRLIGTMLMRAFRTDTLFLPVLWEQNRPVAALGILLDREKKTMLFSITGRDDTFEGPSPGLVLHAHSIREAIGRGYATYDFLRGNEPYKYSFGVEERRIDSFIITRRTTPTQRMPVIR